MTDKDPTRDWRGTLIEPGLPCIYGAPVGRSIELVEGEVVGFTKSGRVNVKIIRRAYQTPWGSNDRKIVHVGHDRLIIIKPDSLPPTTLPTWQEASDERGAELELREANERSHVGPYSKEVQLGNYISRQFVTIPCERCGLSGLDRGKQACTDGGR